MTQEKSSFFLSPFLLFHVLHTVSAVSKQEKNMKRLTKFWLVLLSTTFLICQFGDQETFAQRGRSGSGWSFVSKKYDANDDGIVSPEEYTRGKEAFVQLDQNEDGVITIEDWAMRRRPSAGEAPQVGQIAPEFSLTEVRNPDNVVKLSQFTGKQPVALLFGSCT